jgi:glutamate/tyrosine decarboxylase-like PLP-dependent enzyme
MSGFLAPFMRMNGVNIPPCSLSVAGVTSISADFHKHGYSAKGVSAVLMPREAADRSAFSYSDHPLPPMTTPSLAGTAAGAPIASAWAVIQYLGTDGYRHLASELHDSTSAFKAAIASVDGFRVLGDPRFSILVVVSDKYDMREIHRGMTERNWFTLLVRDPAGLHLNVGAKDGAIAARFAADLHAVTENLVQ